MNRKRKFLSAALILASVFSLCSFSASASEAQAYQAPQSRVSAVSFNRYELSVSKVYNKSVEAYSRLRVAHNYKSLAADARMINGEPYISVESFINEATDMTATYKSASRTLNVRGSGFEMDVIDGGNVIYANGRCLFSMTPSALMSNGDMYAPLANIAKALGLSYSYDSGVVTLLGAVKPIAHASRFYAEDAVYWLSRIISAESRGESLLGQIAVGSVVMNRVSSNLYPNTIWGVIYDKNYGVQFSPILDGSIRNEPVASSVVAAKICLEGFNVNKKALFFLYPRASTSSWIPNNRTYLFSIGKHDFYA